MSAEVQRSNPQHKECAFKSGLNTKNTSVTETSVETSGSNNKLLGNRCHRRNENDLIITPKIRNNLNKLSLIRKDNISEVHANFSLNRNSPMNEPLRILRNKSKTIQIDSDNFETFQASADSINNKDSNKTPQNLAHKTDIIANLLNFDEDDRCEHKESEDISILKQNQPENETIKKPTCRFFHRPHAPLSASDSKTKNTVKITTKKGGQKANRSNKSSTKKKQNMPDNIYEFFSQSQTSDSDTGKHIDPAADIIKKLIRAGKVRVATNCKGKGRPTIKRAGKVRKIQKRPNKNNIQVTRNRKINEEKPAAVTDEINDFAMNDYPLSPMSTDDHDYEPEQEQEPKQPMSPTIKGKNDHSVDGRFSRLARSVLIHQTEKSEINRNDSLDKRRRLLEYAHNFVSTPANQKSCPLQSTDLSPISASPLNTTIYRNIDRPACPSPWRVNDESHLPNTFYFSKNTSHLPSFSCDYIPPTPKKNITNKSGGYHRTIEKVVTQTEIDDTVKEKSISDDIPSTSQVSSFSSNDSNAENMPPTKPHSNDNENTNFDVNADIFNKRQLPNPCQMQSHRSPLRAVNILEVVCLTPWKKLKSPEKNKVSENTTDNNCNLKRKCDNRGDDIFGFEELIDDSSDDPSAEDPAAKKSKKSHGHLRTKLRELRKFRPTNTNLAGHQAKPIQRIFDDGVGRPKQRGIKEMLCSTMINPPKVQQLINSDSDEDNAQQENTNAQKNEPVLFNDIDPEIIFDPKRPHRTYENPKKNKRRMRHNFVMFPDSDTESEPEQEQKKRQKAKIKDKTDKSGEELKSFIDEFNSHCREVESYELIVE